MWDIKRNNFCANELSFILHFWSLRFESFRNQGFLSRLLTNFITGGVHVLVFAIQFIKWWYSEENDSIAKKVMQLPIPDPLPFNAKDSLHPVPENGVCPLCQRFALFHKLVILYWVCAYSSLISAANCEWKIWFCEAITFKR